MKAPHRRLSEERALSELRTLLTSLIGRKALMAATGLLLVGFLIAHVAANLLVLVDHEAFNAYSHKLVSNPLIYLAEVGLLVLFVAHFASGLIVERRNRAARPVPYADKQRAGGRSRKSFASTTMIFSGIVVLVFVPLHILTFKLGAWYPSVEDPAVRDLARLVLEEFRRPGWVLWYEIALLALGFHAWHGVGSAFDSLGISHRTWLTTAGRVLTIAIFAGFMVIPPAIYFGGTP
jgi:succinate dehydrogenase / fumarate reductase cytochrome b subunit